MEEVGPSDSGAAMETTMSEPVGTEGEAEALGKRRHGSESSERYFTLLSIKGWSFVMLQVWPLILLKVISYHYSSIDWCAVRCRRYNFTSDG